MSDLKKANPELSMIPDKNVLNEVEPVEDLDKMMKEFNELHAKIQLDATSDLNPSKTAPPALEAVPVLSEPLVQPAATSEISEAEAEEWLKDAPVQHSESSDLAKDKVQQQEGGSIAMSIQGRMSVRLKYEESQEIIIQFTAEGIQCQLSGGMEFKIPARRKK